MKEDSNKGIIGKPPFYLKEIYCVPFSLNHNREVFLFMLKNGLLQQVKIHCLRISQSSFEKSLTPYARLIEEHLDLFSNRNEYWLGRDNIGDDPVKIFLTLRGNTIQWFFILLVEEQDE